MRITHLLITAVLITVVVCLTGSGALVVQQQQMRWLTKRWQPAYTANLRAAAALDRAESAVQVVEQTGGADARTRYRQARDELITDLRTVTAAAAELKMDADTAERQQQAAATWVKEFADPVISGLDMPTTDPRRRVATEQLTVFRSENAAVSVALEAGQARMLTSSRWATGLVIVLGLALTVAGAVLLIRRGLRTQRQIAPPLEQLHEVVRARRAGDRQVRADASQGVPEIRAIAAELNDLIQMTDRQRARLLEALRLTEAVRDLAMIAGRELDLEAVLTNAVEPLSRMFRTDSVSIRAFEGVGEVPGRGSRATFPSEPGPVADEHVMELAHRAARHSWLHQRCVIIAADEVSGRVRDQSSVITSEAATELLDFIRAVGISSLLIVGVGSGSECVGYLALGRGPDRPAWSTAEAAAALRTGHEIGQAILHARLFEREEFLLQQVQDLDAAKTDFVTSVSHELRTPLTSIVGNLELIRSGDVGPVDDQLGRRMDSMARNAERLTSLIEDLLLLAKVEDRQTDGVIDADLRGLVEHALAACRPAAMARGITFDLRVDHPARAVVDEHELHRALYNVIGNAIKFSRAGSSVTIIIDAEADSVSIAVSDQGIGISSADQRSLFGKFFRSTDPAVQAQPGTGLGLAVAKLIVDRHHGSIQLSSELGQGTTVLIKLPRRAASVLLPTDDHGAAQIWSVPLAPAK